MSHDVETDEQHVPLRTVVVVAVAGLVIFGLGIAWVWWVTVARVGTLQTRSGEIPAVLGATEINIVNQRMFEFDDRAEWFRQVKTERLTSYGWSSREAQRVHVPIDEAMDLWLARQAPARKAPGTPTEPGDGAREGHEHEHHDHEHGQGGQGEGPEEAR